MRMPEPRLLRSALALSLLLLVGGGEAAQHHKLKDTEIGVLDPRGYLLGSSYEWKANGQTVTVNHRVVNGSKANSTVDWRSALVREPAMSPGEARSRIYKLDVSGMRFYWHWPVPYDDGAEVETSTGTRSIPSAPAFVPRARVWTSRADWLLKDAFEVILETVIENTVKKIKLRFRSGAKGTRDFFTYFAEVQNLGEEPAHVLWLSVATAKDRRGLTVSLPKRMDAPKTVVEGKGGFPLNIVSDLAFVNGDSDKALPTEPFAYLGVQPGPVTARQEELRKAKLGANSVAVVPAVLRVEDSR